MSLCQIKNYLRHNAANPPMGYNIPKQTWQKRVKSGRKMKNFPIKPYHVIYILLRLGGFEAEKVEKVRGFEAHLTNFCPSYLYGSFPGPPKP